MSISFKKYWEFYKTDFQETFSLSLPIVISHLGVVLLGVIDNVMVGVLGKTALAAVGIGNAVFMVLSVIGIGVTSVIAPLIAAAKIRQDYKLTSQLLINSIYVTFFISLFLAIVTLGITYKFEWLNQPVGVTKEAKDYLYIVVLSMIPMIIFIGIKSFCEGLGKMRPPMYILYLIIPLNILLNWLLMFGHFGFPELGLKGTAWATLICRFVMLAMLIGYLINSKAIKSYLQYFSFKNYEKSLVNKLLSLGLPSGFQYLFEAGAFTAAAVIVGWLGETELAAHQIAISLASMTYMMVLGFSVAGSIRVGSAKGLRDKKRILKAGNSAIFLSILLNSLACITFIVFSESLAKIYIDAQEVVVLASTLLIMTGIFQLPDGLQAVGLGLLRGIEDVNLPTLFTLIAYWVLGIPFGTLLAFYFEMGALGIWIGLTAGLTTSAVLSLSRFYFLVKNKYAEEGKSKKQALKIESINI